MIIRENRFNLLEKRIDELMINNKNLIVAIDGPCGSGKSSLANLLKEKYKANVFHLDDFFLTPELQSESRLKEPGGNVDYERFYQEVILGIKSKKSFTYYRYNCKNNKMEKMEVPGPRPITVVEGSYSFHPYLKDAYDFKIFLTIEPELQRQRILTRNGQERAKVFYNKWIPLENLYFQELDIKAKADIVLDGSIL